MEYGSGCGRAKKPTFIYLHGSHPVAFITEQTTLIQSNTTQAYFNSTVYPYIEATCLSP